VRTVAHSPNSSGECDPIQTEGRAHRSGGCWGAGEGGGSWRYSWQRRAGGGQWTGWRRASVCWVQAWVHPRQTPSGAQGRSSGGAEGPLR